MFVTFLGKVVTPKTVSFVVVGFFFVDSYISDVVKSSAAENHANRHCFRRFYCVCDNKLFFPFSLFSFSFSFFFLSLFSHFFCFFLFYFFFPLSFFISFFLKSFLLIVSLFLLFSLLPNFFGFGR